MSTLTTIAARSILIAGVLALAISANALRAAEPGVTFATSGVTLTIDSKGWYNGAVVPSATWSLKNLTPGVDKYFNFTDIKPGDTGRDVISMHVKNTDSWLCLDFNNLHSYDGGINEPESKADTDPNNGELADELEFFGWIDDGDGMFEVGEKPLFGTTTQAASDVMDGTSYAVGDAGAGKACKPAQSKYVGITWCAGDLTVNLATAQITCNPATMGNEAQTDTMSVDIAIRALPSSQDNKFLCATGHQPPKKKHEHYHNNHGGDDHHNDRDDHGSNDSHKKYSIDTHDWSKDKPSFTFGGFNWYGKK